MLSVKLDVPIETADAMIAHLGEQDPTGEVATFYNYLILCREQAIRGAANEAITELQAGGL